MSGRELNLVVDMYGCPNRCKHCWLGHMPNKVMEEGADRFLVDYFSPYFDRIAYYSWGREPDFCEDYRERWEKDLAISKNTAPQRFELASFYRIARDDRYLPFLKSVGTDKVQLTFFGMKETQDRYVGRRGAFEEILRATDLLIAQGMIPRWQCFINEENIAEILEVYALAKQIRQEKCPELEFFVHEGSCDGENRKLYSIRIEKDHIPAQLLPVYLDPEELLTEQECCALLKDDHSHPVFETAGDVTLNISNTFDAYFNFTNMSKPWIIGNLKTTEAEELMRRINQEDTHALREAKRVTWADLVHRFGDFQSRKVFRLDDYKMFLFNNHLEQE